MGMPLETFERLTLPEIRACLRAWGDQREAEARRDWETARTLGCMIIQPFVKGSVDPKRVLPLPWDSEATEATDHEETSREEAMRRRRELMERMGLE